MSIRSAAIKYVYKVYIYIFTTKVDKKQQLESTFKNKTKNDKTNYFTSSDPHHDIQSIVFMPW